MTVMARHAPVMTSVKPGVVSVKTAAGSTDRYVVFGGFADVLPETLTILAESAVAVKDIDREDLAQRIKNAREDITDAKDDETRDKAKEELEHLLTLESGLNA
jgi:F-type H+-transporting ATPase subunit epsilon